MTPKEIQILHQACVAAGVYPSKIQPDNPFKKSGGTAQMLQAAVAEIDPAQAAKWRTDSGQSLSVATMAELHSGEPLSDKAKQQLWDLDPKFVEDVQKQQVKHEQDILKQMRDSTAEKRWNTTLNQVGGDQHQAKRVIEAEDQRMAAQQQQQAGV